jgi:hypothetical protein
MEETVKSVASGTDVRWCHKNVNRRCGSAVDSVEAVRHRIGDFQARGVSRIAGVVLAPYGVVRLFSDRWMSSGPSGQRCGFARRRKTNGQKAEAVLMYIWAFPASITTRLRQS